MRWLALLVLCLAAVSCAHTQPSDPNRVEAKGTVRHQDMEGGFYGLVADDGAQYDPGTLPADFQKDGLRVRFVAHKTGAMTIRMWGTPVEVESIEKI